MKSSLLGSLLVIVVVAVVLWRMLVSAVASWDQPEDEFGNRFDDKK